MNSAMLSPGLMSTRALYSMLNNWKAPRFRLLPFENLFRFVHYLSAQTRHNLHRNKNEASTSSCAGRDGMRISSNDNCKYPVLCSIGLIYGH